MVYITYMYVLTGGAKAPPPGVPPEEPAAVVRAIGRRIAELRVNRGWTQEQFAERLGIHARYLSRLEGGGQNFSVHRLVWIARALGVHVADLFVPPKSVAVQRGRPARK